MKYTFADWWIHIIDIIVYALYNIRLYSFIVTISSDQALEGFIPSPDSLRYSRSTEGTKTVTWSWSGPSSCRRSWTSHGHCWVRSSTERRTRRSRRSRVNWSSSKVFWRCECAAYKVFSCPFLHLSELHEQRESEGLSF